MSVFCKPCGEKRKMTSEDEDLGSLLTILRHHKAMSPEFRSHFIACVDKWFNTFASPIQKSGG